MAEGIFGWDLLYNSVSKDVKTNQDLLTILVHYVLVAEGFKCIGLGESKVLEDNEGEAATEALPDNWNKYYIIRYLYQGKLYILKCTSQDDALLINLLRVDERNVSLVQLNTRSVVKRTGKLEDMIPDYKNIMDVLKKQLINKVTSSSKYKDSCSQTVLTQTGQGSNQRMPVPSPGGIYYDDRHSVGPSLIDPVGRNDLNPFGIDPLRVIGTGPNLPAGGGMIFSPPPMFGGPHTGLPTGAIPPGARFDPFRPPEVDRFRAGPRRPDNDEMPPPGYDDMFM